HRDEINRLESKMTAEFAQRDAALDAKLEEIAAELRRRDAEMNELHAQLGALQATVTETMRKNALANEEIASLLRSTSWRVPAPTRALGRVRRAARGR